MGAPWWEVAGQKMGQFGHWLGDQTGINADYGQVDPSTGQIDTSQGDAARAQQQSLIAQLQGMNYANRPSVADMQLRQAADQNMQQAMSMGVGAQTRGMGIGSAMRAAMRQRANIGGQLGAQSAIARAQEQQMNDSMQLQAMGMAGNGMQSMRGQDMQQAQQQTANNMNVGQFNSNVQLGNRQQMGNVMSGIGQAATAIGTGGASLIPGGFQQNFGSGESNGYAARGGHSSPPLASGGNFQGGAYTPQNRAHGGIIECLARGGQTGVDSEANDVVPAMLSPGEIVLPRSVAQSVDAPEKAAAFVEMIRRENRRKPKFARAG